MPSQVIDFKNPPESVTTQPLYHLYLYCKAKVQDSTQQKYALDCIAALLHTYYNIDHISQMGYLYDTDKQKFYDTKMEEHNKQDIQYYPQDFGDLGRDVMRAPRHLTGTCLAIHPSVSYPVDSHKLSKQVAVTQRTTLIQAEMKMFNEIAKAIIELPEDDNNAKLEVAKIFVENVNAGGIGCAAERLQPAVTAVSMALGKHASSEITLSVEEIIEMKTAFMKAYPQLATHARELYMHDNTSDLDAFYEKLFIQLQENNVKFLMLPTANSTLEKVEITEDNKLKIICAFGKSAIEIIGYKKEDEDMKDVFAFYKEKERKLFGADNLDDKLDAKPTDHVTDNKHPIEVLQYGPPETTSAIVKAVQENQDRKYEFKQSDDGRQRLREVLREMHGYQKTDTKGDIRKQNPGSALDRLNKEQDVQLPGGGHIRGEDIKTRKQEVRIIYDKDRITPQQIKHIQLLKAGEMIPSDEIPNEYNKKFNEYKSHLESLSSYVVVRGEVHQHYVMDEKASPLKPPRTNVFYYANFPKLQVGHGHIPDDLIRFAKPIHGKDPKRYGSWKLKDETKKELISKYKDVIRLQIKMAAINKEGLDLVTPNAFLYALSYEDQAKAKEWFAEAVAQIAEEIDISKEPYKDFKGLYVHRMDRPNPQTKVMEEDPFYTKLKSLMNGNTKVKMPLVLHAADAMSPQLASGKDSRVAVTIMGEGCGAAGNAALYDSGNYAMEENATRMHGGEIELIFGPQNNTHLKSAEKYEAIDFKSGTVPDLDKKDLPDPKIAAEATIQAVLLDPFKCRLLLDKVENITLGNAEKRAYLNDRGQVEFTFENKEEADKFANDKKDNCISYEYKGIYRVCMTTSDALKFYKGEALTSSADLELPSYLPQAPEDFSQKEKAAAFGRAIGEMIGSTNRIFILTDKQKSDEITISFKSEQERRQFENRFPEFKKSFTNTEPKEFYCITMPNQIAQVIYRDLANNPLKAHEDVDFIKALNLFTGEQSQKKIQYDKDSKIYRINFASNPPGLANQFYQYLLSADIIQSDEGLYLIDSRTIQLPEEKYKAIKDHFIPQKSSRLEQAKDTIKAINTNLKDNSQTTEKNLYLSHENQSVMIAISLHLAKKYHIKSQSGITPGKFVYDNTAKKEGHGFMLSEEELAKIPNLTTLASEIKSISESIIKQQSEIDEKIKPQQEILERNKIKISHHYGTTYKISYNCYVTPDPANPTPNFDLFLRHLQANQLLKSGINFTSDYAPAGHLGSNFFGSYAYVSSEDLKIILDNMPQYVQFKNLTGVAQQYEKLINLKAKLSESGIRSDMVTTTGGKVALHFPGYNQDKLDLINTFLDEGRINPNGILTYDQINQNHLKDNFQTLSNWLKQYDNKVSFSKEIPEPFTLSVKTGALEGPAEMLKAVADQLKIDYTKPLIISDKYFEGHDKRAFGGVLLDVTLQAKEANLIESMHVHGIDPKHKKAFKFSERVNKIAQGPQGKNRFKLSCNKDGTFTLDIESNKEEMLKFLNAKFFNDAPLAQIPAKFSAEQTTALMGLGLSAEKFGVTLCLTLSRVETDKAKDSDSRIEKNGYNVLNKKCIDNLYAEARRRGIPILNTTDGKERLRDLLFKGYGIQLEITDILYNSNDGYYVKLAKDSKEYKHLQSFESISRTVKVEERIRQSYSESAPNKDIHMYAPDWVHEQLTELNLRLAGITVTGPGSDKFTFPLTLVGLSQLARNEQINTTGEINFAAYYPGIDPKDALALRDLVKHVVTVGKVKATHYGGYPNKSSLKEHEQQIYVCDLVGMQFQDPLNTGRQVLITEGEKSLSVLEETIYKHTVGKSKPLYSTDLANNSRRYIKASFHGKEAFLDTKAMQAFIQQDFMLAARALNSQAQANGDDVCFRFLAYGTGFFLSGLNVNGADDATTEVMMKNQTLQGVLSSLSELLQDKQQISQIKKVDLPFYLHPAFNYDQLKECNSFEDFKARSPKSIYYKGYEYTITDTYLKETYQLVQSLKAISKVCQENSIQFSAQAQDALTPITGSNLKIATTNCADPHAPLGNEMYHRSVDAAIAENLEHKGNEFNPWLNTVMKQHYVSRQGTITHYKKPEVVESRRGADPLIQSILKDSEDVVVESAKREYLKVTLVSESSKQFLVSSYNAKSRQVMLIDPESPDMLFKVSIDRVTLPTKVDQHFDALLKQMQQGQSQATTAKKVVPTKSEIPPAQVGQSKKATTPPVNTTARPEGKVTPPQALTLDALKNKAETEHATSGVKVTISQDTAGKQATITATKMPGFTMQVDTKYQTIQAQVTDDPQSNKLFLSLAPDAVRTLDQDQDVKIVITKGESRAQIITFQEKLSKMMASVHSQEDAERVVELFINHYALKENGQFKREHGKLLLSPDKYLQMNLSDTGIKTYRLICEAAKKYQLDVKPGRQVEIAIQHESARNLGNQQRRELAIKLHDQITEPSNQSKFIHIVNIIEKMQGDNETKIKLYRLIESDINNYEVTPPTDTVSANITHNGNVTFEQSNDTKLENCSADALLKEIERDHLNQAGAKKA